MMSVPLFPEPPRRGRPRVQGTAAEFEQGKAIATAHFIYGVPFKKIAANLGMNRDTVRVRLAAFLTTDDPLADMIRPRVRRRQTA